MSIAQSLLDIVLDEGRKHHLTEVKTIRLQVGAMAAVVPESLTFCFDMLSRDTMAAGAVIEIESIPIVARCAGCGTAVEVEDYVFLCPQCGESALELISGRELALLNIEGEIESETGDRNDANQGSCGSEHSAG